MDQKAIVKAESRLRLAKAAAEKLAAAKDYESFTDEWYAFLVALKNIWTVLQQGAKVSPQSRQWFGAKEKERRGDELLQYLFEARNDDEHGLEPITEHQQASLSVGVNKPGYSNNMLVNMRIGFPDGNNYIKTTPLDGRPVLIEQAPERFVLSALHPRGRPNLPPPTMHLGAPVKDATPTGVATSALVYMSALVEAASARA
jgi:hypothetical protein